MKKNNTHPQNEKIYCGIKRVLNSKKLNYSKAFPTKNLNYKDQNTVLLTSSPAKEEIKISYIAHKSSQISVSLYDHFGKRIAAFNKAAVEGENRFLFSLKQFCAGIYSIQILDINGKALNKTIQLHKSVN